MSKRETTDTESTQARKRAHREYAEFTLRGMYEGYVRYMLRMHHVLAGRVGFGNAEDYTKFDSETAFWWHAWMCKWCTKQIPFDAREKSVAQYAYEAKKLDIVYELARRGIREDISKTTDLGELLADMADSLIEGDFNIDAYNPLSLDNVGIVYLFYMNVLANYAITDKSKQLIDKFAAGEETEAATGDNDDGDAETSVVNALIVELAPHVV